MLNVSTTLPRGIVCCTEKVVEPLGNEAMTVGSNIPSKLLYVTVLAFQLARTLCTLTVAWPRVMIG